MEILLFFFHNRNNVFSTLQKTQILTVFNANPVTGQRAFIGRVAVVEIP